MPINQKKLNKFINNLIDYSNNDNVDNQYKNKLQVKNLKKYFKNMYLLKPTILFVGEAPGYQGCAITGIPFTSEFIIKKYKDSEILNGCIVLGNRKEPTATIIWEALDKKEEEGKLISMPLFWNIFPFHPIKNANLKTNRKPTAKECSFGLKFINELLDLFPTIEKIYAIGKLAAKKLDGHKKFIFTLRHPSNGGKSKFIEGIDKIYY